MRFHTRLGFQFHSIATYISYYNTIWHIHVTFEMHDRLVSCSSTKQSRLQIHEINYDTKYSNNLRSSATLSIKDKQHNTILRVIYCYAECCSTECRYAECCGAIRSCSIGSFCRCLFCFVEFDFIYHPKYQNTLRSTFDKDMSE